MMGKAQSDGQKLAVSAALKGRKKTPESIEKRRTALLAKRADQERKPREYDSRTMKETIWALSQSCSWHISLSHADVSGERNPNYGKRKFFNPLTGESVRAAIGEEPVGWIESSEWRKMNRRKSDTIKT